MSLDDLCIPGLPGHGSGGYRPGDLIAKRYRLVRLIGSGGMGAVWVAEDMALDALVALKLLLTDGSETDDAAKRLRHEARAAARLGHPGIVRVLDFGLSETGDPFIAMELLDGETLTELLRREQRLPAIEAVALLLPVADALVAAHKKKIVHRDLKPDNVLIARVAGGRVQPKLVDFGIASFEREATRPGSVANVPGAGSIDYMSPEQIYDQYVDHRSDVWSYSVVLYQCATGHLPFSRENSYDTLRAITDDSPVPIHELCAGDAALWRLVEHGLRKDPDERWSSMRELGQELARWLLEHDVSEDACGGSLRSTWLGKRSSVADKSLSSSTDSAQPPRRIRTPLPHESTFSTRPPPKLGAPRVPSGMSSGRPSDEMSLPVMVPRSGSPRPPRLSGIPYGRHALAVGLSLLAALVVVSFLAGVGRRGSRSAASVPPDRTLAESLPTSAHAPEPAASIPELPASASSPSARAAPSAAASSSLPPSPRQ
jgi:eukaryotic-like serine/threonine-protein kinase